MMCNPFLAVGDRLLSTSDLPQCHTYFYTDMPAWLSPLLQRLIVASFTIGHGSLWYMQQPAFRCDRQSWTCRVDSVVAAKSIGGCCFISDARIAIMTKAINRSKQFHGL
ncbi:hypothetical protein HBH56_143500 [Parastagonospora nodorum]|uniref:Uncharacterized protein n=1 Tax=Phaeosphaeria nodorum (strain SN15 / ATCC MYA-4574 / FGSC 10173) TaxID=321614 RepID=A0A7U2FA49_PHANO|nr:hypothetical protein HBH56_143500 [Parastagonospora nodorum]QRD01484.1 hypothetical protein JI435_439400 [Parastagonospora nodorum SN15]KAH3927789.1 hypothetical protein HBH54_148690 [Parastagonospora nodorum]KAH4129557.1 hypothetical protein HBH45_205030 [Parastagonospora nodorum]KAH4157563.1 hypothetical protein HBH44_122650 [Parastagonospora nodorum]